MAWGKCWTHLAFPKKMQCVVLILKAGHALQHTSSMDTTSSNSTAPFDIRTLYNTQQTRTDLRKETYDVIVRRAHHRIQTVAKRNEIHCVFQLPQMIVGMPLYDPFECCGYLIRTLKQEGFLVKYYHPNILYINWAKEVIAPRVAELNAQDQRSSGTTPHMLASAQMPTRRPEYRESGRSMQPPSESSQNLFKQLPTVNLSYKPTGKLFE